MYEATGEEVYKEFLLTRLNTLAAAQGTAEGLPKQDYLPYFFAYGHTRNQQYCQKIEPAVVSNEWSL